MRTQAVRLDEDTILLVNAIAKFRGSRPSDVHRDALDRIIDTEAEDNDVIRTLRDELRQRRRAALEAEVAKSLPAND